MAVFSPRDELITLEHSTLKVSKLLPSVVRYISSQNNEPKVPYELLNKKFRAVQKVLDREITQVTSSSSELSQCVSGSSEISVREVNGLLSSVEQRLVSLKRKAEECLDEEIQCTKLCKSRLDHLKSYVSGN